MTAGALLYRISSARRVVKMKAKLNRKHSVGRYLPNYGRISYLV